MRSDDLRARIGRRHRVRRVPTGDVADPSARDLDGAIERLRSEGADSLFAACMQRGFVWGESAGRLHSLTYDFRDAPRRQDLGGEHWEENGSFYVFRPWVLDELGNRLGGTVTMWPMHPLDSFQVDEPGDLELTDHSPGATGDCAAPVAFEHVRLLCFDFDGVLTDNRVLVDEHGTEAVFCDRSDGWGIARVRELGSSRPHSVDRAATMSFRLARANSALNVCTGVEIRPLPSARSRSATVFHSQLSRLWATM